MRGRHEAQNRCGVIAEGPLPDGRREPHECRTKFIGAATSAAAEARLNR